MYRISVASDTGTPTGSASLGIRPGQTVAPQAQPIQSTTSGQGGYGTGTEPTIVPDARSNSIIIITDRNTYKTLEQLIQKLDTRRPQVLIKATVVEIRTSDRFDLGVELNRLVNPDDRVATGFRNAFGQSGIERDVANNVFNIIPIDTPGVTMLLMKDRIGNIGAMLKAIEGKAKVSVLDEPEAVTSDNGKAEMTLTVKIPVPNTTVTGTGIAQTSFTFEEAKTLLSISPHISEGGYLRLETTVRIEKFTRERVAPNAPPTRTSREIKTEKIMIPSSHTMVIGGIVTQDETESVQGTPLLSHIPVIGWLFRRQEENHEKTTLYIFITPYILYDDRFGDYGELTKERKEEVDRLRGAGNELKNLNVDLKVERLPESRFQFQTPRSGRKED
jgi:type II secretory pathway component GspD/PulD (secretin)